MTVSNDALAKGSAWASACTTSAGNGSDGSLVRATSSIPSTKSTPTKRVLHQSNMAERAQEYSTNSSATSKLEIAFKLPRCVCWRIVYFLETAGISGSPDPPSSQPAGLRMDPRTSNELAWKPPYAVTLWGTTQKAEKYRIAAMKHKT